MKLIGFIAKIINKAILFLASLLLLFNQAVCSAKPPTEQEYKIVYLSDNLVVTPATELLEIIARAKENGANSVLFSDSKLNRYGIQGTAGNLWDSEMKKLVDGIRLMDMNLFFVTITMGFAGALLSENPNLTTGYPILNQQLKVVNNTLEPINSAQVVNGDFENYKENVPNGWYFQDAPGQRTFIDTVTKHSGKSSFKAIALDNQSSRISTRIDVKPFHQYVLKLWIKTDKLTAGHLMPVIRDDSNLERDISKLKFSMLNSKNVPDYMDKVNNLTMDWTEMRIAFNSLDASEINLMLAVFDGVQGQVWWDDVSVEESPFLNWINRSDLNSTIKKLNGEGLEFGKDVYLPADPKLGQAGYSGSFDVLHEPPVVTIPENSSANNGDTLIVNGYHALLTNKGQVSASWNSPDVYTTMKSIHHKLQTDFKPDGFLINYSEIRTGGWEPTDLNYASSGEALSVSINKAIKDLFDVAPDTKCFLWSDMFSPHQNAVNNYYQVNNTLDSSWVSLDPEKVLIANWISVNNMQSDGSLNLKFYSDKGFKQIIAGYYDMDVRDNYTQWKAASDGVSGIVGSMFTTWTKDYTDVESFAELWWSDTTSNTNMTVINTKKHMHIFPNPNNGNFCIDLPKSERGIKTIELLSLSNKLLVHKRFEKNKIYLNLTNIAKGAYLIRIVNLQNGHVFTGKVFLN